jgi:hypothetical protein
MRESTTATAMRVARVLNICIENGPVSLPLAFFPELQWKKAVPGNMVPLRVDIFSPGLPPPWQADAGGLGTKRAGDIPPEVPQHDLPTD